MIALDGAIWWYVTRASGLVLWVVSALAVGWGFAVSSRLVRRTGMPAWMTALHQHLGTLAMVFTGVHLVSLWADSYVAFGWRELFVPMASTWRPGAVAWGVVAFWCLVAVQLTSWFRRRLPRRIWRAVHLLSLPMFVTGTAHGVLSGADWPNRAVQWGLLLVSVGVVWTATFRLLVTRTPSTDARQRAALARAAAREEAGVPG